MSSFIKLITKVNKNQKKIVESL